MYAISRKAAFFAVALAALAVSFCGGATAATAQSPCPPAGRATTTAKLATCAAYQAGVIDSLRRALSANSGGPATLPPDLEARLQKLELWEAQGRPTMADFYRKLPPDGRTVQEYVNSAVAAVSSGGSLGNVVNGDLILNGRLCIPDACLGNAGEQIQIRAQKGAGILFQANRDGLWNQSPCAGMSVVGQSPDLGLRLIQNQRWTQDGTHVDFICADHPTGAVGFDSQAEWSFNGQKPGQSPLGTQRLVIRTDEVAKIVYFATWAEGWKVQFRGSTDGCKWCENIRWAVPYQ